MADGFENPNTKQDGADKSLEKERRRPSVDKELDKTVELEKDLSKLRIQEETIPYDMKCPICQDKRRHPLTLPCGHTFCYLCIKGVYARQRVCALCRQPIPSSCIMSPPGEEKEEEEERGKVRWYYQAKSGGWWVYEERVTLELEKSYQSLMQSELEEDKEEAKTVKEGERDKLLEIQISGFPYIVDFQRMIQYRQDKPDRIRRIKRDTAEEEEEALVRGVAGVPLAPTIKPQDDTVQ